MLQTETAGLSHHFAAGDGLSLSRSRFSVVAGDAIERPDLEARVRSGFGTHFGACIHGFMRELAYYRHDSGASGVIGIRPAADESLYLENYLDAPIESLIASLTGTAVPRGRIVEVGQFVIDDRDAVADFFRDLVPFLAQRGFDWVCFTGTGRIRALLARIGFHGLPVAVARPERVSHLGDRWGSYYDTDPIVVVGKLSDPFGSWCEARNDDVLPVRATG